MTMHQCLQCSREYAERQPANRCPVCRGNVFPSSDPEMERRDHWRRKFEAVEYEDLRSHHTGRPSNVELARRRALLEGAA
jgi:DNA-directed RNA polymerase subunit RPC12/RpoP